LIADQAIAERRLITNRMLTMGKPIRIRDMLMAAITIITIMQIS
jgi:hypothetical protein